VDITAITTLLGLSSIIVGIIGSLHTMRRFAKARQLSIFMDFLKQIYDKEFIKDMLEIQEWTWESVDELFLKYGPQTNPDEMVKWARVGSYFDGIGKIVEKGLINHTFIPETLAISIINFWEKFEPWVDELDVVMRRKNSFGSIKRLYELIHKLDHQHPDSATGS
jgi:hypothetical protein